MLHDFISQKTGEEFPESVLRSFNFSLLPYITRRVCKGIAVCIFEREVGTQTIFNGHAHEVENLGNVVKVCQQELHTRLCTFLSHIASTLHISLGLFPSSPNIPYDTSLCSRRWRVISNHQKWHLTQASTEYGKAKSQSPDSRLKRKPLKRSLKWWMVTTSILRTSNCVWSIVTCDVLHS